VKEVSIQIGCYTSGRKTLAEQGLILEIAIIPKVLLNPEIGAILIRED